MTTYTVEERTQESLERRVRESAPLIDRLHQCMDRIGKMCAEHRGPRMTIPVEWSDDDFFICCTLEDAARELAAALNLSTFEQQKEWLARKLAHNDDSNAAAGIDPSCLCCGKVGTPKVWVIDNPFIYVCETCKAKSDAQTSASEPVAWLYEYNGKADVSIHRFRTLPATFVETPLIRAGTCKVTDEDVLRAMDAYHEANNVKNAEYPYQTCMRAALESFAATRAQDNAKLTQ